jgi:putative spermidine/putrescine transport system permease protein
MNVVTRWPWRLQIAGQLRRLPKLTASLILLAPTLVLLVGLYIYPLIVVLSRSLTDPRVGFDNYTALWQSVAFRNILTNTFEIALWTTAICLLMGYPLAYRIATLPPLWSRVLLGLVLLPFFTAILARLYSWSIILGDEGVVNTYLQQWGIIHQPLPLLFDRTGVVIGTVHYMLPYMILVLYSTMLNIDDSLLQAARSLGASRLYTFRRVFLPLTLPGVYAGSLLVFIISLGFFLTPAILGGGHDVTIATFVKEEVGVLAWGAAAAMCVVLLAVTSVLFLFFDRLYGTDRLLIGGLRK